MKLCGYKFTYNTKKINGVGGRGTTDRKTIKQGISVAQKKVILPFP